MGAVRRRKVERTDFDGAQRTGQPGLEERVATAGEADAHPLGRRGDPLVADALEGADRRDVQRVLESAADEDRAAFELVGVARCPVLGAIELGRHVKEQAALG